MRSQIWQVDLDFEQKMIREFGAGPKRADATLNEWAAQRKHVLDIYMQERDALADTLASRLGQQRAWRLGTQADKNELAEEVGKLLNELAAQIDKPIQNRLAFHESIHGGSVQRELDQADRELRLLKDQMDTAFGKYPR